MTNFEFEPSAEVAPYRPVAFSLYMERRLRSGQARIGVDHTTQFARTSICARNASVAPRSGYCETATPLKARNVRSYRCGYLAADWSFWLHLRRLIFGRISGSAGPTGSVPTGFNYYRH